MLGRNRTILTGIPQKADMLGKVWGLGQIPEQSGHLISHFGGVEKGNRLEICVPVLTLAGS